MIFRAFDIRLGDNLMTHDLFIEICEATEIPSVPGVEASMGSGTVDLSLDL
jgi:hypothetical protein